MTINDSCVYINITRLVVPLLLIIKNNSMMFPTITGQKHTMVLPSIHLEFTFVENKIMLGLGVLAGSTKIYN